jgi:pseudouridine synthase
MNNSDSVKIHAYIAHQGIASRRKAEELVQLGKVRVNGEKAIIGQRIDPQTDKVTVEGNVISKKANQPIYLLINKPAGYVSTTSDELGRKNVLDLVPANLKQNTRLYPVGRLDLDSEGLMLLTNDGDLAFHLTHPKFEVKKTYHVLVAGTPTELAINHLRKGVKLREGFTSPADVEELSTEGDNTWLSITIHEGRYHQVKRMLERVGYDTLRLIRVSMGQFNLDQLQGQKYLKLSSI